MQREALRQLGTGVRLANDDEAVNAHHGYSNRRGSDERV